MRATVMIIYVLAGIAVAVFLGVMAKRSGMKPAKCVVWFVVPPIVFWIVSPMFMEILDKIIRRRFEIQEPGAAIVIGIVAWAVFAIVVCLVGRAIQKADLRREEAQSDDG